MEHQEAVAGLLKWWHRRWGIVPGARNANVYKLAAAFTTYGIPYSTALAECLRFVDLDSPDPFTASEIQRTVESAYKRTEHGVKQWRTRTAAPIPSVPALPPIVNEVDAFIRRHHLEHLVEALDLDMDRARMVSNADAWSPEKSGEIERHVG